MAIPIISGPYLPRVPTHSGCGKRPSQICDENQNRSFSAILGEAFLSRGEQDPCLTATLENLVFEMLRQMMAGALVPETLKPIAVKSPCLTCSGTVNASPEPVYESDERQRRLQADAKSGSDFRADLNDIIQKASKSHNVDAGLISAVIRAESNFNPSAASSRGAMGLMQLMPETARELGVENPYDPEENVMGGVRYLKSLLNRYAGNVKDALAAYNWGMGNLERNSGRLPAETRGYIVRVLKYYEGVSV